MVETDMILVREELDMRLDTMARIAGDARELLRQLHSAKGLAQAYGLRPFAEAVHRFEGELIGGMPGSSIGTRLAMLRQELEAA